LTCTFSDVKGLWWLEKYNRIVGVSNMLGLHLSPTLLSVASSAATTVRVSNGLNLFFSWENSQFPAVTM
jgi:hypothetical protein